MDVETDRDTEKTTDKNAQRGASVNTQTATAAPMGASTTPVMPNPMSFDSWAARPAPRRQISSRRDTIDLDALKIFLILAGLTAGMALGLRLLF